MPFILAPFLVEGLVFLAGIVALVLAVNFNTWFGSASADRNQGGLFGAIKLIVTAVPKALGIAAQKIARSTLSHWALAHVKPVAMWLRSANILTRTTYAEMAGLATDTAWAFQRLVAVSLPALILAKLAPVRRTANQALTRATQARAADAAHHREFVRYRDKTAPKIAHATHAVDVTIPGEFGRIRAKNREQDGTLDRLRDRVGSLEDGAIRTFEWLSAHRTSAAMGVFTGAVAWALTRLGYGFLRCRSWQNLGRSLKCSDANVLAELLAGATAVALSMSLVDLAKAEQEVMGDISALVRDFWQA